jgi:hypothetical protein
MERTMSELVSSWIEELSPATRERSTWQRQTIRFETNAPARPGGVNTGSITNAPLRWVTVGSVSLREHDEMAPSEIDSAYHCSFKRPILFAKTLACQGARQRRRPLNRERG